MDDYPEELAPEFEDSGAVKTPFDIWWPQVNHHFENVPENVAKQWLHRHWRHSPYSWLRSKNYKFNLTNWESKKLGEIWSRWYLSGDDFDKWAAISSAGEGGTVKIDDALVMADSTAVVALSFGCKHSDLIEAIWDKSFASGTFDGAKAGAMKEFAEFVHRSHPELVPSLDLAG